MTRGFSKDDRGLPVRVCPSSIVSVSSLLRSIATCSWHFTFFEYVVIAVQYLRTSHGIHVYIRYTSNRAVELLRYTNRVFNGLK